MVELSFMLPGPFADTSLLLPPHPMMTRAHGAHLRKPPNPLIYGKPLSVVLLPIQQQTADRKTGLEQEKQKKVSFFS